MLRFAVISTLFLAACDVGSLPGTTVDGGAGDGSGSGSCAQIIASPPDGHHNPGQGCRSTAACHNMALGLGAGAPEFSYAGTAYKDKMGTTPYAGATVYININGMMKAMPVATNGNFWAEPSLIPAPTASMAATTSASACPNTAPMSGSLTNAGGGDCNSAACHAPGSSQGTVFVTP